MIVELCSRWLQFQLLSVQIEFMCWLISTTRWVERRKQVRERLKELPVRQFREGSDLKFSNCANFSRKLRVSLQNLRIYTKSTHLICKFTHPFLQSYWNFTFSFQSIIYIEIYSVLLLAKLVPNYAFLVC